MPTDEERRRAPRKAMAIECRVEGIASALRLTDLSLGGGYVDSRAAHVQPGAQVTLAMVIDDTEVHIPIRIVYVHHGIGFGFEMDLEHQPEQVRLAVASLLDR